MSGDITSSSTTEQPVAGSASSGGSYALGAGPSGDAGAGSPGGAQADAQPGIVALLPESLAQRPEAQRASALFDQRPEIEVGVALAAGLLVAIVLKKLTS